MNEYINKTKFLEQLRQELFEIDIVHHDHIDLEKRMYEFAIKKVEEMNGEDVEPIKYGHWIYENLGFGAYRYRCSECGNLYGQDQIEDFEHNKFCGDCGAKMDDNEVE